MKAAAFVLVAMAMLPFGARAEDAQACSRWVAGMVEDEGGEVLLAETCALDAPEVRLTLACAENTMLLRYDLANGAQSLPELEAVESVSLDFGDESRTLELRYEEMDGMFATGFAADDPLVGLLQHGATVEISTASGHYGGHSFGLAGSGAVIGALLKQCR